MAPGKFSWAFLFAFANGAGATISRVPLLEDLQTSALLTRASLQNVPQRGIYAFYENEMPLYVGRSNRIRRRIQQHGRPSSGHNSATFAFRLALEAAKGQRFDLTGMQRSQLETNLRFKGLYDAAKSRVAAMGVRVIQIDDPVEQTIFEVYAALTLATPYNEFENH